MTRGLIVGRFQPYHIGHHEAVKRILKETDELIIVVGSSDNSHSIQNPFTAGERIEMISRALKAEKLFEKCFIVTVADVNENTVWTSKIKSYCPKFETVYTNNPLVKQLFEGVGVKVKKMVSQRSEIDGVKIREKMLNGENWKELVPAPTAKYLDEINSLARIKAITEKEEKE
ncbi:MAG: nicotinamide-nucleotide adenylyltransferase [Candidatus Diapherotrites archaeon]|nr:nicotinamide-nucleotide adenylyltransferase [Candidatus Diapherotrites archaeon]